ncbi:LAQU0S05e02080g1_1 [Lachancea quebecensis]|uniref:LAQU0S05e02080g1_1 n=1 Tax=Lachancea quebecensis TaxID=1654605 RepID=A0A0P1KRJ6_9SACH|nr:LAQU0S05e02080g1_1 [Lachancea quebecensis]
MTDVLSAIPVPALAPAHGILPGSALYSARRPRDSAFGRTSKYAARMDLRFRVHFEVRRRVYTSARPPQYFAHRVYISAPTPPRATMCYCVLRHALLCCQQSRVTATYASCSGAKSTRPRTSQGYRSIRTEAIGVGNGCEVSIYLFPFLTSIFTVSSTARETRYNNNNIHKPFIKMLRSTASHALRIPSRLVATPAVYSSASRVCAFHSSASVPKSLGEKVRSTLSDLNKKVGEAAASGIDKAQEASHTVEEKSHTAAEATKHGLEQLNKKTGQAAASGIDKAQNLAQEAGEKAQELKNRDLTQEAKDKAQELKDRDLTQEAKDKAQDLKEGAQEKAGEAKGKAQELKHEAKGKAQELKHEGAGKAQELKHEAKGKAHEGAAKAKETAREYKD